MTRKDNSFNNARKIGALSDLKVIRDSVGSGDNADFLSFRVKGRSSFRSVLRGLGRNVDLVLFDKDRNRLTASRNPGRQSELVDTLLDRGLYFLKVQRKGGKSNYRLRLSAGATNSPDPTSAEYVGLTDKNTLAFFNDENLSNVTQVSVTGLQSGESLVGVDFRPNTGELFGVGSTNRLYTIDITTGTATQVGTDPFAVSLDGTSFGVDFNPTVDRIRVVSDAGQNLRLNPDTGAVVDADTLTGGVQTDGALNGATNSIVATAYTNSFGGATTTVQYGINADTDQLFIQNPPNNGTQTLVGSLGVDFDASAGFNIVTSNGINTAYATSGSSLYSINLNTGAASLLGDVRDINQSIALTGLASRA